MDDGGGRLRAGVDLVAVDDVRRAVDRFGERYLARVFTPAERACATGERDVAAASLAGRFAAKEAALKALEPGPEGASPDWRDIEIVRLLSGACRLRLHGRAAWLATREGIADLAVSLSHEGPLACAVVVARLDPHLARRPSPDPRPAPRASRQRQHREHREHQGEGSMDEDIRGILATHGRLPVDVATIDDEADLYQIGLTSHASVNVMLALEEHFDVEFPPEMLRKRTFGSVRAIREALMTLTGARA